MNNFTFIAKHPNRSSQMLPIRCYWCHSVRSSNDFLRCFYQATSDEHQAHKWSKEGHQSECDISCAILNEIINCQSFLYFTNLHYIKLCYGHTLDNFLGIYLLVFNNSMPFPSRPINLTARGSERNQFRLFGIFLAKLVPFT